MKTNTSTVDRGVRVGIAVATAIAAFVVGATSLLGIVLLVVAVVMLATAAVGFCPIYRLFGMSTCRVPSASAESTTVSAGR